MNENNSGFFDFISNAILGIPYLWLLSLVIFLIFAYKKLNYLFNDDFNKSISPTIKSMKNFFGGSILSFFHADEIQAGSRQQSEFSFHEVVDLAKFYEKKIEFLLQQLKKYSQNKPK